MKNYLEYKGYMGTMKVSAEDKIFYGKIHGINDLVLFEGKSFDELQKSFKEAVDDYLELCERHNKQPEKTYKGMFNARISPELHRAISASAIKENLTLNQYVENALEEYIKK